jgi:trimeric autotransporter adhesin
MRKLYVLFNGKSIALTLLSLFVVIEMHAQTDISIGTGTAGNGNTSYPCPFQDYYEGSRSQYLYLASELHAAGMNAGMITAIKFRVTDLLDAGIIEKYAIKIGGTAVATLGSAATWEPVSSTVFGPVNYQPVAGVNTITLTTPYSWNGTDNIIIEVCNGDDNTNSGTLYTHNPSIPWTTGLPFNGSHSSRDDNQDNLCNETGATNSGTQTTRPNITFAWTPAVACTGTPVAGTAASTPSSICLGQSFTLSLTGQTIASGITIQWQQSPNGSTNWTNIAGGTGGTLTTTQSATSYYRAVVTCTNSGASANSNAVQVTSATLVSGTYTIKKNGGGDFTSFQAAYDFIRCGINGAVVFNVAPGSGPYNEQLIMNNVPGSSVVNSVTFNGNGNTISFNSTNSNERAVVKLNGAKHVTFDNLTIDGSTGTYGFTVQMINNADSNTISHCVINTNATATTTNFAGIVIGGTATSATTADNSGCDANRITANTINGGDYGITTMGSATTLAIQRNIIEKNIIQNWYNYGIYVGGSSQERIDSNDITRAARPSAPTTSYGIYLTGLSVNARILKNRIHAIFDGSPTTTSDFSAIYFSSVDALGGFENVVANNIIYDIKGNGTIYGLHNVGSDNALYYYNTIALNTPASTPGSAKNTRGIFQTTAAAGIQFRNNLITIDRGGSGPKHGIYMATATTTYTSNNNDLYLINNPTHFVGYDGSNRTTLLDWQTATSKDANSASVDPVYANLPIGNLEPTSSPLNNLGAPFTIVTDDIKSRPRDAGTPDIGAYEFTVPVCTTPPTAGTAFSTPSTSVCPNTAIALSLNGNSDGTGQTYQWFSAPSSSGPWTAVSGVLPSRTFNVHPSVTTYYRADVTCSGNTASSIPVQVIVSSLFPAGTYTINSAQPTAGTNFISFGDAYNALKCGIAGPIVFNVNAASGPYNEQLIIDSIQGASATNTVTFNGNGRKIHFSSGDDLERAVIKLRGADHIIFDSLVVDATGAGAYGFGIQLISNADSNTVKHCTIIADTTSTSTNFSGIVISYAANSPTATGATLCDYNTLDGNTIMGGCYGITAVSATTSLLDFNKIINNKIRDFYNYGIYASGSRNMVIEANSIERPFRTNVSSDYSIYLTSLHEGAMVTRNSISNPFGGKPSATGAFYGIYINSADADQSSPNTISNNVIYNINGEGAEYGMYNVGSDNVKYLHNTISLDHAVTISGDVARGFYQTSAATGIELRNNIITVRRGGSNTTRHAIYMATSTTSLIANNNDYFVAGDAARTFIGYSGANQATLTNWQAASAQDANSIAVDPAYTDLGAGNLIPRAEQIENKGAPLTPPVTVDINLNTRSTTTPDLGAYEFTVPACTTPPLAGASSALPSSNICMETPVRLDLSGNSIGAGQRYQWEYSTTANGVYSPLGDPLYFPDTTILASTSLYYRAAVTCSGGAPVYSTPVLVSVNPAFLSGFYTIDNTQPTNGVNFHSFAEAISMLECGISGFVTFNVKAGTYTEQVRMHRIRGASATSRVTFRAATGDPSSVVLTYAPTTALPYTLQLDSASYITYRDMTIQVTDTARAVEIANTASYDSIVNCTVKVMPFAGTATQMAGIYANGLRGTGNVIKGNKVSNGFAGIYINGNSASARAIQNTIDSNTITGAYQYGIYAGLGIGTAVTKNTVKLSSPLNVSTYGVYMVDVDSAYNVSYNTIHVDNDSSTNSYAIYLSGCNGSDLQRGTVAGNKVMALTGNTKILYGLYESSSSYNNLVNNVININTSGTTSYGLYTTGGGNINVLNNTVLSKATAPTNNAAAYFNHTSASTGHVRISNNVFSHEGGGKAMQISNAAFIYSDYNFLYTTGAALIQLGNASLASLQKWRDTAYWDINSIVYKPAFASGNSLQPDPANPDVWAMHGRGVQVPGNSFDINQATRPVTLMQGVPDMGAYEFVPTADPVLLTAIPAAPVPNTTQIFMLGTDTVTKVDWGATVPATVQAKRYSGIKPPGLANGQDYMYFYTDFDITGPVPTGQKVQQFYVDSWQGFIANQGIIKLGRTDATNNWIVAPGSKVDSIMNTIIEPDLTFLDRYTGLTDGLSVPNDPIVISPPDTSNRGKNFWVAYGHHQFFGTDNSQNMVLYLSAEQDANVTVSIKGTSWSRTYHIAANTVITSEIIPKYGLYDARMTEEGLAPKGIHITSDVPIVAYAHIYGSASSGATMLLPVGTYGYEYYALTSRQNYASDTYSWVNIIADQDNTLVEITPSNPTKAGRPAGVSYTVTMNKGDVYQVLGAIISGAEGYDLTGTKVRSIPNTDGKCLPVAVFSGSSRTGLACGAGVGGSGDNIIQQNFPFQAWGRRYLAAPTSASTGASSLMTNIFRVAVKDPTTVVKRNGVPLTGLINNYYYQFESNAGEYIEADKPVMMAQFMSSSGSCPGTSGDGDPEMFYISPLEQGIKKVGLYRNNVESINSNYLTLIIPTSGLNSLQIDGATGPASYDYSYVHPSLAGYTVVVKKWTAAKAQAVISSDSAFTAITYGLGSVESYGYNAGTLVKNLNTLPSINNVYGPGGGTSDHTCDSTPFRFNFLVSVQPTNIQWKLSNIPNMLPNADVNQANPVPAGTEEVNGRLYYRYTLPGDYVIRGAGTYYVPIIITHPDIESCNNTLETTLAINVIDAPVVDFSASQNLCVGQDIQFNGIVTTANGAGVGKWDWNFNDGGTAAIQAPTHPFTTAGTHDIKLSVIADDGCIGDTVKQVVIGDGLGVRLVKDSLTTCAGSDLIFEVQDPVAGAIYSWFNSISSSTVITTGTSFTVTNVTGPVSYFVESNVGTCAAARAEAKADVAPVLSIPVATVDSIAPGLIRFAWSPIVGATGYEVTLDGGGSWMVPSSGPLGLTHTVAGLQMGQTITLQVRPTGGCDPIASAPVSATTVTDEVYIPNSFTPNGDGRNDQFRIYSNAIRSMRMAVFNQWGQKIYESSDQLPGWDGTYKGKIQPSGVYMYVADIILTNGQKVLRKGAINLIR